MKLAVLRLLLNGDDDVVVAHLLATEIDLDLPAAGVQALVAQRRTNADELLALERVDANGAHRGTGQVAAVMDDRGDAVGTGGTIGTIGTICTAVAVPTVVTIGRSRAEVELRAVERDRLQHGRHVRAH